MIPAMHVRLRWLAPPPPVDGAQPLGEDLGPGATARAFSQAADENILTLVVVGWCRAAWDLLRSEPRLNRRSVYWIISALDVPALEACAAVEPGEGKITVAAVAETAEVAQVFARVGGVFSLVVMSCDSHFLYRLQMMRIDNFVRQTRSLDRSLRDFSHLVRRLDVRREFALVESWKDAHRGAVALCVAAGPGLDHSVELLRRLAPDCIIICVDVAYRKLSAAGIRCDYVLNVDSHDAAVSRMEGVPGGGATLVMPIDGNAKADAWFSTVANFVPPALAGPLFGGVGADFARGTNVGAATVGWALHLGCSEILLLGHDLSFPAEAAYSAFVPEHERHGRDMLAKVGRLIAVPGNGGVEVMTDQAFKIACSDLAALLRAARGQAVVYNYNINLGRGALIGGTVALPDGWTPSASARHELPSIPLRTVRVSGQEWTGQVVGLIHDVLDAWRGLRASGTEVLAAIETLGSQARLGYGKDLLWPAITGHLLHLTRLAAMRTGQASAAHIRCGEQSLDELIECWAVYVTEQITGAERPPAPAQLPAEGARFLALLAPQAPRLRQDSFEGALIPMLSRERISLRHHLPDLVLPMAASAEEACHVLLRVGGVSRPRDLVELLCLCSLEGERLRFVLDLAVEAGLLTGPQVCSGSLVPWLSSAAPEVVDAHDALIAALGGGPCPDAATLSRIIAWHPTHLLLIIALLGSQPVQNKRVAALERLVAEAALPLDDAVVGVIISHHPDPLAACTLLDAKIAVAGPATALAIAKRLLDIQDLAGARAQYVGVGSLGRCAEDRLAMEGAFLLDRGRLDEFLAILGGWTDREAGYRSLYRILAGRVGPAQAMQAMASDPLAMLDPTLVGELLAGLAARAEPLPQSVAVASRQLLGTWLAEPRTSWDREQAEQTLDVLNHYAGLAHTS